MDSPIFWSIFEAGISLLENFLLVLFMNLFLGARYSGIKQFLLTSGMSLLGLAFSFVENEPPYFIWEPYITILALFLYAIYATQGSLLKKAVGAVIARELIAVSNSLILFLAGALLNTDVSNFITQQNELRVLTVLLTKVTYFFLGRIVIGLFSKRGELLTWQWAVTGSSFFVSTLAGTLAIRLARNLPTESALERIELLVIVSCLWVLCFMAYFVVEKMMKSNQAKLEYELLKQNQEYQMQNLAQMAGSYEEVQAIRHDMKNYLLALQHMLEKGEYQQAKEECVRITGKVDGIHVFLETGSQIIDAILNEKLSESKRKGIDTKCSIFTDLRAVDTLAFCTVFGNLMDNAIEAQEPLPESERHIEVEAFNQYGYTRLRVTNITRKESTGEGPDLKTTKPDAALHGIGHRSVERTMEEIDGAIRYQEGDHLFIATAIFPQHTI